MAAPPVSSQELEAAVMAYRFHGSKRVAANALGIPRSTLRDRLEIAQRSGTNLSGVTQPAKGRIEVDLKDGTIVVFSDAHFWPGPPSTAFLALIKLIKKLKPKVIIANGDLTDMATISRHPPLGWASMPTVQDELEICQERLGEIAKACGKHTKKLWPVGNHDSRLECRLAQVAPELKNVYGTSLADHFPDWEPCYSVFVNADLVVKHRFKGGQYAHANNSLWSGRTYITGHLHNQAVIRISDLNGTRWGVDTGCLADIYGEQFSYLEDNPRSWQAGFVVVSYVAGRLLTPELVRVVEPDLVEFRGELIEV